MTATFTIFFKNNYFYNFINRKESILQKCNINFQRVNPDYFSMEMNRYKTMTQFRENFTYECGREAIVKLPLRKLWQSFDRAQVTQEIEILEL